MKFADALRLSWSNIAGHKRRSAIVVLTVAVLFGVIMGVNFVLDGLERSMLEMSVAKTDGKVYVETRFTNSRYGNAEMRLDERLAKYHGEKLGKRRTWWFGADRLTVVDVSVVAGMNAESRAELGEVLIDDGSGTVEMYVAEKLAEVPDWELRKTEETVVVFRNYADAKAYVSTRDTPEAKNLESWGFSAGDLIGNAVGVISSFASYRLMLKMFGVVLLVVAGIIAALSFAHLIDSDAATVALYRAMGASTGNIQSIYLLYLVELCLLAVGASMVIAAGFAGVVAGKVAGMLQEFYGLAEVPRMMMPEFGAQFWQVVGLIMLVAPLTLALTIRRFSPKHIAKKLKEE